MRAPNATSSRRAGRDAALDRLLDFYLATASGVYALERPGDRLPAHLSPTDHPGLSFTEPRTALDWLFAEADPLLACVRQAAARGGETHVLRRAVDLLWAAKDLAESGANSKQYESSAVALRDAARAAKDPRAEGRARTTLTMVYLVSGLNAEADDEARQAMALAREADDPLPSCWAPNDRGIIALHQGRYADGERFLLEAIENFRADDNNIGEASALCNLSRIHVMLGRLSSAIDLAQQGIAIYDRMGLTLRLANGRYALGIALTQAGQARRGAGAADRGAVPVPREPAAPVGGRDPLPAGRGPSGRAPAHPGRLARRAGDRAARHRRGVAAGHGPDGAGQGAAPAGADGPGAGLLAGRGDGVRAAGLGRTGRGTGSVGFGDGCLRQGSDRGLRLRTATTSCDCGPWLRR